jgi:hypothetical protein
MSQEEQYAERIEGLERSIELMEEHHVYLFNKIAKAEKLINLLTTSVSGFLCRIDQPSGWLEQLHRVESNCMGEILKLKQIQEEMKLRSQIEVEDDENMRKYCSENNIYALIQRVNKLESQANDKTVLNKVEKLSDLILEMNTNLYNPRTQYSEIHKVCKVVGIVKEEESEFDFKTTSKWGNTFTTRQGDNSEARIERLEHIVEKFMLNLFSGCEYSLNALNFIQLVDR